MIPFEIYMASDHAGFNLRQTLADLLTEAGHIVHDLGPETDARVDYPDFGEKLAKAMKPFPDSRGVLVCGSGIGISIAANRFPWIRAALCHDVTTAVLSRQHNDANVIAFGERLIGETTASDALMAFLETKFEGGRHQGRVQKLSDLNA
jgi:ribose 5-phosphate isomerase B